MSLEQTDAIVLRVFPWSETSCVASIFTRDFGKKSVLAKGARRPKSPFEAALDLLSMCRVVFIPKSADALDLLTEAKLSRRFRAGTRDLLRLYCGYYLAELLERFCEKDDKHPDLFELAEATLLALEEPDFEIRAIVLRWELQMLRILGHLPNWENCVHCGKSVELDQEVVFGAIAGGILCLDCQSSSRQTIRIANQVRVVMLKFSEPDWRSLSLKEYSSTHRKAIRGVMKFYFQTLLDSQLRLDGYLEELGR